MGRALAKRVSTRTFLVPGEKAVAAIESCASALSHATTVEEVTKLMTQAEAVAMWVRASEASDRVKRDAQALSVHAERRLGEIAATIQKGKLRGIAAAHKIDIKRLRCARKLAALPAPVFQDALNELGHRATRTTMAQHFGFQNKPAFVPAALRPLATDAIALLDKCCDEGRTPPRAEVVRLQLRLAALNVEKARP